MIITIAVIVRVLLSALACLLAYKLGQHETLEWCARTFARDHGIKLLFADRVFSMLHMAKENPNDTIRAFTDKDAAGASFIIDVRQNLEADNG